jgi:hypothetical protein
MNENCPLDNCKCVNCASQYWCTTAQKLKDDPTFNPPLPDNCKE